MREKFRTTSLQKTSRHFFFFMRFVKMAIEKFYKIIYCKATINFFQTNGVPALKACFNKKENILPPSDFLKKLAAKASKNF